MKPKRGNKTLLKISKDKVKKIGKRSIHDIIHNSFDLSFWEKVSYIRHHYTYYDGNQGYFYDENGKANSRRNYLNCLIIAILKGNADPSQLKNINDQIINWRNKLEKQKLLDKKIQEELAKINAADEIKEKVKDFHNHNWSKTMNESNKKYCDIILEFINSKENNIDPEIILEATYSQMKKVSLYWKNNKEKKLDYNKLIQSNKMHVEFYQQILTPEELEAREQKRAEKLMRQYAIDLGYLKDEK